MLFVGIRFGKIIRNGVMACCLLGLLAGCASAPPAKPVVVGRYSQAVADKAAATALAMVGRPYKFKGDSPAGFDCSGLVRYSYLTAGMEVPHSTDALKQITRPVATSRLRKGDLLFFTELGKKYSHVGIYEGGDKFVHAPSTGKQVREDSLKDPYWKKHFLGGRRFS